MKYIVAYLLAFSVSLLITSTLYTVMCLFDYSVGAWLCLYISLWAGTAGMLNTYIRNMGKK